MKQGYIKNSLLSLLILYFLYGCFNESILYVDEKKSLAVAMYEAVSKEHGEKIIFSDDNNSQIIKFNNKRNEFVKPVSIDKFIQASNMFKDKYNTFVYLIEPVPFIAPKSTGEIKIYVCKDKNSINILNNNPYTFIAFLSNNEIKQIEDILYTTNKLEKTIPLIKMKEIVKIIKNHTVAYPYDISEKYSVRSCFSE